MVKWMSDTISEPLPGLNPRTVARLQRYLPSIIAILFGLAGAAGLAAVFSPGITALVFLGGATAVGLVIFYGMATGALNTAPAGGGFGALALQILQDSPEACLVTRRDGWVVFANTSYSQFAELMGARRVVPLERLLAGQEKAAAAIYKLARAARDGLEARQDFPVTVASGEKTWLKVDIRPVSGFRHQVLWRIQDTGPERQAGAAKQALIDERKSLLTDFDLMPIGLVTVEAGGKILLVNRMLETLLGDPGGLLVGRQRSLDIEDLFAGTREALDARLAEAVERSVPTEFILKKRDGDAQRVWVVADVADTESEAGKFRLAIWPKGQADERGVSADAPFSAESLAEFLDQAPIGILIANHIGNIRLANPAGRAFLGAEVTTHTRVQDLVAPEDRPEFINLLRLVREGAQGRDHMDLRLAGAPSRAARLYVSRLDPVPGGDGTIILYLVDTTHQKSLEQQFAQSQKMQAIGQLAGGIAHDFNNLLTAIIGFCDLLVTRHQPGDPSFTDLNQIKQNAIRAANLTRQLLAFSRRQTLRPKVLQLTDVLAELTFLLRRLIGETIELKIVHDRNLGLVKVDQGQFEQVIVNLVVNARDAMPKGGTLTINTRNVAADDVAKLGDPTMPAGEYVAIEVTDTGIGIPKENLGKIFDPFFTTKKDEGAGQGTGLGLSTVYGIIKQTEGFISVDSVPNKGTTFRIYLRRHKGEEDAVKSLPKDGTEKSKPQDLTGAGTILLVEDEEAVRMFASRALKSRGYTVLEAGNGEVALEVAEAHDGEIDVLVSDVVMPAMDGPTLVSKMRDLRPNTKIIFISGYAETAFRNNLDKPEDFHFLPKPFTLKQLAATVKDVMTG